MSLAARLRLTSCAIFFIGAGKRFRFPVSANDRGANDGLVFSRLVFTSLVFIGGDGRRIRETLGLHVQFDPMLVVAAHIEFGLQLVEGKKQEFANEGQVGGVAWRCAVLGDGLVELAKGKIDVRGGHEPARESGGEFGAEAVGFDNLTLGTSVENAERGMILLAKHAAGAAVGKRVLTERGFVGGDAGTGRFWFIHGLYSLGEVE